MHNHHVTLNRSTVLTGHVGPEEQGANFILPLQTISTGSSREKVVSNRDDCRKLTMHQL